MGEQIEVSIIVPVYNTEKYLAKCLDSITAQSLRNIEILCVNDGSLDGSSLIVKDYIAKDSRIRLIEKDNGGLVSARKCGIAHATGKYVGFVDSDDWIEPDMFEKLYEIASWHDIDMVSSGYIMEGQYISREYDTISEGLYVNDERKFFLENCIFHLKARDLGIRGSLCCKLFRRELMQKALEKIPNSVSYSEDKLSVITFALMAKRFYIIRDAWYHYIIRGNSMTQGADTSYLTKINEVYKYLISLYDHPDFSDNMRKQAELYITQLLIKGINSRMGFSIKNLMWIDSDWMHRVPENKRILLYGSGELAQAYKRQVENSDRLIFAGMINASEEVGQYYFNYILITIKNRIKADEIREELILTGIEDSKILWFEQKEIFWKYAVDAGLC